MSSTRSNNATYPAYGNGYAYSQSNSATGGTGGTGGRGSVTNNGGNGGNATSGAGSSRETGGAAGSGGRGGLGGSNGDSGGGGRSTSDPSWPQQVSLTRFGRALVKRPGRSFVRPNQAACSRSPAARPGGSAE